MHRRPQVEDSNKATSHEDISSSLRLPLTCFKRHPAPFPVACG